MESIIEDKSIIGPIKKIINSDGIIAFQEFKLCVRYTHYENKKDINEDACDACDASQLIFLSFVDSSQFIYFYYFYFSPMKIHQMVKIRLLKGLLRFFYVFL